MKFRDVLVVVDYRTSIRLFVEMYNMDFCVDHSAEYFASKLDVELFDREVIDIRVVDGLLEVALK